MSIEEVRALVAERQRYDDWLAALETKRADTPPRVFERVQGDYVARRADVITRLQSHVEGLATLGGDLEQRLSELEGRLAGHEEELAEGMLRNLVGEFDNERWETVRQDVEARIAALSDERGALAAEVEDVRTLLANARVLPEGYTAPAAAVSESDAPLAPTPAVNAAVADFEEARQAVTVESAAPAATPRVVLSVEVEAAASEWASMEPGLIGAAAEANAEDASEDASDVVMLEATFAETVEVVPAAVDDTLLDIDVQAMVDNPVPTGQSHEEVLADVAALFDTSSIAAVPEPPSSEPARQPMDQEAFDDALAMFGEVSGPADPHFVQSLQGIEAEHEAGAEATTLTATPPTVPPVGSASAPSASAPSADPFDDLAFLRSVIDQGTPGDVVPPAAPAAPASAGVPFGAAAAGEPQKTLRCTECGTMNLPTEWYCERCGGELAAF